MSCLSPRRGLACSSVHSQDRLVCRGAQEQAACSRCRWGALLLISLQANTHKGASRCLCWLVCGGCIESLLEGLHLLCLENSSLPVADQDKQLAQEWILSLPCQICL